MSIKQFITLLIILCLSAWHYSAAQEKEASHLPPVENGTLNFSPLESGSSPFSPFENEKSGLGISDILSPDIAFVFSTDMESPTLLVARWQIAEGYYLYRNQFKFALKNGGVLGEPLFPSPPGKFKEDVKYGRVEVYEHQLEIKLPVQDTQGLDSLILETSYQGCADERICYPPIQKTVSVDLPPIDIKIATDDSMFAAVPPTSQISPLDPEDFLDAEEAFVFSAEFPSPSYLVLRWKIADGYYLFRDKLAFSLQGDGKLGTPQLPPSILDKDPLFGDVQIYRQSLLEIRVPIDTEGEGLEAITLSVDYQGCAVAGLCYPPITKVVDLQLGIIGKSSAMSEQDQLAHLLASANVWYTLIMFFGLGLLLSLTPCIFPMIPILSSIIVGQGKQITPYKAFMMSLIYVLAMAFTYAIVGVLTGLLGENLQAAFQNPWLIFVYVWFL
jgi:thiol:disulfide interchange protein DsbD